MKCQNYDSPMMTVSGNSNVHRGSNRAIRVSLIDRPERTSVQKTLGLTSVS